MRSADPTTLALASLDAEGVARWSFYSADTAAAGLTPQDALAALPPRVAALHVGTLGLVLEPLATAIEAVVQRLADETMVVLDPNVRPQAIRDPAAFRARLERVIARSHLVKVSEEDVAWLDPGSTTSDAARALLARGASAVLLTRGAAGATVLTDGRQTPIDAVPTKVADTIGAGDAFGGGMLAWWISHGLGRAELADHALVVEAARFGATRGGADGRAAGGVAAAAAGERRRACARGGGSRRALTRHGGEAVSERHLCRCVSRLGAGGRSGFGVRDGPIGSGVSKSSRPTRTI